LAQQNLRDLINRFTRITASPISCFKALFEKGTIA